MRLILAVFLVLSMAIPVWASDFIWDAPTTNEDGTLLTDLAGYKVYCGHASNTYSITKDAGMIPADAQGVCTYPIGSVIPQDGNWYCVATAYDTSRNESKYSNEIFFVVSGGVIDKVSPSAPGNFRFRK